MKDKYILCVTALMSVVYSIYNNNNNTTNNRSLNFTQFQLEYLDSITFSNNILKLYLKSENKQYLGENSWIGIYDLSKFSNIKDYDKKIKNYKIYKQVPSNTDLEFDISKYSKGKYIIFLFGDNGYGMILDSLYFYKEDSNKYITEYSYKEYTKKYYQIDPEYGQDIFWIDKRKINSKLPLDQVLVIGISGKYIQDVIKLYMEKRKIRKKILIIEFLSIIQDGLGEGKIFMNHLRGSVYAGVFVNYPFQNEELKIEDKKYEKNYDKYKLHNGIDKHTSLILNRVMKNKSFPVINFGDFTGKTKYMIVVINTFGFRDFRTGISVDINLQFDKDKGTPILYTM